MRPEDNPKFSGYKGPVDERGVPNHGIKKPSGGTTSGVKPSMTPTPRVNAKKIESNAKKIEKIMGMLKGR